MTNTAKLDYTIFRTTITYSGKTIKPSNRMSTGFCKATSKEEADEFFKKQIEETLRKNNFLDTTFNIKTTISSQDEVDFYLKNVKNKNYSGIMN